MILKRPCRHFMVIMNNNNSFWNQELIKKKIKINWNDFSDHTMNASRTNVLFLFDTMERFTKIFLWFPLPVYIHQRFFSSHNNNKTETSPKLKSSSQTKRLRGKRTSRSEKKGRNLDTADWLAPTTLTT